MASHPHDLYLAPCGKNNKASNSLNQKGQKRYWAYKADCDKAEKNIVSDKNITVNSTPTTIKNYIQQLDEAKNMWNSCKVGRVNFRRDCINPKYINDNWPDVPYPEDTHGPPIRQAKENMDLLKERKKVLCKTYLNQPIFNRPKALV